MSSILNSYFVKTHRLEISITIIAIVLFLIYFFGATHVFTRFPIYRAFMQSMPFFGIIAISATFVVTLGEIDLSFPSIVGITSLTFGMLLTSTDGNFFISFALATALGMFAGLVNGLLVTKIGIPSIVATIGTLFFWRGLVNVISQGSGIAIVDEELKSAEITLKKFREQNRNISGFSAEGRRLIPIHHLVYHGRCQVEFKRLSEETLVSIGYGKFIGEHYTEGYHSP